MNENETRKNLIDEQLNLAGWKADTQNLNYKLGTRPTLGENIAIAEYPTSSGPADYILFCGLDAIATVEAKKDSKDVPGDLIQAKRYSKDFQALSNEKILTPENYEYKIPFAFSSNGREFSEVLPTKSGIWFADLLKGSISRPLRNWYTPEGLKKVLSSNINFSKNKLSEISFGTLRPYQKESIKLVEEAIINKGKRECLLSLATGTGKTIISLFLIHRMISSSLFNRILFVVDRKSLATQALDKFSTIDLEYGKTLSQIYNIDDTTIKKPSLETQIHIVTIQGLMKRVLKGKENEKPKIDDYDCIIIDECHRGYFLDQEMDKDEIMFDNHDQYFSSYKKCINYFDAVKIGITATPAIHTVEIFGEPIFTYAYREAVIDGWLVDHETPKKIYTQLSKFGIRWNEGDEVKFISRQTSKTKKKIIEDELNFGPNEFNKLVVTRNFNKAISETLANEIDPNLQEKSLFFAANDEHADILVDELKKAFNSKYGSINDNAIMKITGSIDRPGTMIKKFQYEKFPNIVVTVDLLTTGIDILPLCNIVFVRNVNSRILFEQMLGRATRPCPEIGKEFFRVFDTIGVYNSMGDFSNIKPVVQKPKKKIEEIISQIKLSATNQEFDFFKEELLVKLNSKKRFLTDETKNHIKNEFKKNYEEIVLELTDSDKGNINTKQLIILNQIIEKNQIEKFVPVSQHEDKTIEIKDIISDPNDYIEKFNELIKSNKNKLNALKVLSTSPKSLNKKHLKEIYIFLAENGFKEQDIQSSYKKAKNLDVAARIVGFIRQASIGDPLKSYEERVKSAFDRLIEKTNWSSPQKKWLQRISKQIVKETIIDKSTLSEGAFKDSGGFDYLDKVFEGELNNIIEDINENIWKAS